MSNSFQVEGYISREMAATANAPEREIEYKVLVNCFYSPCEGDGWNSPVIDEYVEVEDCRVVEVIRHNADGTATVYEEGFIGPPEDYMLWFHQTVELTDDDRHMLTDRAWEAIEDMERSEPDY